MKNRCRLGLILILIITASIFVSCGFPNYFYLDQKRISFRNTDSSQKLDNETNFSLNITSNPTADGDLNKLETGPGLLLLYYINDSSITPYSSDFQSLFKSQFQGTNKLGISSGSNNEDSVPFLVHKTSDMNLNLCAFYKNSALAKNPNFHLNLDRRTEEGNINYKFKLMLDTDQTLKLYYTNNSEITEEDSFVTLTRFNNLPFDNTGISSLVDADYNPDIIKVGEYYIHIYAATTCQVGSFTNPFWSDLKHVGYIKVTEQENWSQNKN